jgi:hypothetical protein
MEGPSTGVVGPPYCQLLLSSWRTPVALKKCLAGALLINPGDNAGLGLELAAPEQDEVDAARPESQEDAGLSKAADVGSLLQQSLVQPQTLMARQSSTLFLSRSLPAQPKSHTPTAAPATRRRGVTSVLPAAFAQLVEQQVGFSLGGGLEVGGILRLCVC